MECPKCSSAMRYDRADKSYASGVSYNREHFYCSRDGVWVAVETPVEPPKEDET